MSAHIRTTDFHHSFHRPDFLREPETVTETSVYPSWATPPSHPIDVTPSATPANMVQTIPAGMPPHVFRAFKDHGVDVHYYFAPPMSSHTSSTRPSSQDLGAVQGLPEEVLSLIIEACVEEAPIEKRQNEPNMIQTLTTLSEVSKRFYLCVGRDQRAWRCAMASASSGRQRIMVSMLAGSGGVYLTAFDTDDPKGMLMFMRSALSFSVHSGSCEQWRLLLDRIYLPNLKEVHFDSSTDGPLELHPPSLRSLHVAGPMGSVGTALHTLSLHSGFFHSEDFSAESLTNILGLFKATLRRLRLSCAAIILEGLCFHTVLLALSGGPLQVLCLQARDAYSVHDVVHLPLIHLPQLESIESQSALLLEPSQTVQHATIAADNQEQLMLIMKGLGTALKTLDVAFRSAGLAEVHNAYPSSYDALRLPRLFRITCLSAVDSQFVSFLGTITPLVPKVVVKFQVPTVESVIGTGSNFFATRCRHAEIDRSGLANVLATLNDLRRPYASYSNVRTTLSIHTTAFAGRRRQAVEFSCIPSVAADKSHWDGWVAQALMDVPWCQHTRKDCSPVSPVRTISALPIGKVFKISMPITIIPYGPPDSDRDWIIEEDTADIAARVDRGSDWTTPDALTAQSAHDFDDLRRNFAAMVDVEEIEMDVVASYDQHGHSALRALIANNTVELGDADKCTPTFPRLHLLRVTAAQERKPVLLRSTLLDQLKELVVLRRDLARSTRCSSLRVELVGNIFVRGTTSDMIKRDYPNILFLD